MGKAKAAAAKAVEEEEPVVDKKALKEAKKEAKKEEKLKMKELAAALSAPTGPADSMQDAELFLSKHGVPAGLPRLTVDYAGRLLSASSSQYVKSKAAHRFLQEEPTCTWTLSEPCTLLMVDPDAPERNEDASMPGKRGPWLHWMMTDCKGTTEGGFTTCDYMAPQPAIGNHRYIFILCKGTIESKKTDQRISFDLQGFLKSNNLHPVAANFCYVSAGN